MRVERQWYGFLDLSGTGGVECWIHVDHIGSIRTAFGTDGTQSIITVGPVELQVDCSPDELREAIKKVHRGEVHDSGALFP